jgi:hypothetical protein
MDALFALAGGAGIILAPYLCLRALVDAPESQRGTRILYAVAAVLGVCISFYLAVSSWLALIGVAAALIYVIVRGRRPGPEPDFVVEGPLLDGAVSPQLAAQLASLEQRVRDGESIDEIEIERPEPDLGSGPRL